jgi:hypothetical protein
MARNEKNEGFAKWAVIEVQGNTSLDKIAKEAKASRRKVNGALGKGPDNAKDQGFAKFCMEVQSGLYSEVSAHDDKAEKALN